jgi:hypothetical protein
MGGNGVQQNVQGQTIVCQFQGVPVDADASQLRAEVAELLRRKVARGAVRDTEGGALEIAADLDGQTIEMLRLELRRLARQYGADAPALRVERLPATAC